MKFIWIATVGVLMMACAQPPKKDAEPKAAFRAMGAPVPTEIPRADDSIGFDVRHQIDLAGPTDLAGVVVMVEEGVVTLRGSVTSRTAALRAEGAARMVKGVKAVVDQMQILQTGPVTY